MENTEAGCLRRCIEREKLTDGAQSHFSGAQQQDKGQRTQTEAQEVPSEHE